MAEAPRTRFKTAEGRFTLFSEKPSSFSFNYQRSTRLTLASLKGGAEEGQWIVWNCGDLLNFSRYDSTQRVGGKGTPSRTSAEASVGGEGILMRALLR